MVKEVMEPGWQETFFPSGGKALKTFKNDIHNFSFLSALYEFFMQRFYFMEALINCRYLINYIFAAFKIIFLQYQPF